MRENRAPFGSPRTDNDTECNVAYKLWMHTTQKSKDGNTNAQAKEGEREREETNSVDNRNRNTTMMKKARRDEPKNFGKTIQIFWMKNDIRFDD